MKKQQFEKRLQKITRDHEKLIQKKNKPLKKFPNGIYLKYKRPVITDKHTPLFWRYDLDHKSNPHLMERMGINAAFNAGALFFEGKFCLMVRVEGWDRKSFFAVAESKTGIDGFRFWDYPVCLPQTSEPDVNVYDMRLTEHEDGWIYGVFCTERKDPETPDPSAAVAQCGLARTKNLVDWERLPDIKTPSPQQRNCVLHPELVNGQYAFYTRPQDDFIQTGSGGGIGWGLCEDINKPVIKDEVIIDRREYHTVNEVKNGQGPAPLKTRDGWLHLAHGVRNTAAGLRYVLYMFLTDLKDPSKMIKKPGGYFLVPTGLERVGDVSNVVFSNGWIARGNGDVYIYYGSSDTRVHVATSGIDRLLDHVHNTPEDGGTSAECVAQRTELIKKNKRIL